MCRVGRLRTQVFVQIGKDRPRQMSREVTLMRIGAHPDIDYHDVLIVQFRIVDLN